jgi:N-glycosylase/DNA lyase
MASVAVVSHPAKMLPTNPLCLRRIAAVLAKDAAGMSIRVPGGWKEMSEKTLWSVLASCILGSQVSNSQIRATLENLEIDGLAEPWQVRPENIELARQFQASLAPRSAVGSLAKRAGYRFPRKGAFLLARAVNAVYGAGGSIRSLIADSAQHSELRRLLVAKIPGIGPKQASLFLLEIGVSDDFASLDRHLLRYIALTRPTAAWDGPGTLTPGGLDAYERLESGLRDEAAGIGVSLASLDTAIWVLMRTWSTYADSICRNSLGEA